MIETDRQRRWWFATHPQYSRSHRGPRAGKTSGSEKEEDANKVEPSDVDEYVDTRLKYEGDDLARDLLKSIKQGFGREAVSKKQYLQLAQAGDPRSASEKKTSTTADHDKRDPTFWDAVFKGIDNTLQDWKRWFPPATVKRRKRWKVGDDMLKPTPKGNDPTWPAQRQRYWKNRAAKKGAVEKYGPDNVKRMKTGGAPQRINPKTGKLECSRELHHHPIPQREGGKKVIEVSPEKHAELDPYRRLKKR